MKINIDVKNLVFVDVPNPEKKYRIANYDKNNKWLVERDSDELNAPKINIDNNYQYKVLGASKDVIHNHHLYLNEGNYVLLKI